MKLPDQIKNLFKREKKLKEDFKNKKVLNNSYGTYILQETSELIGKGVVHIELAENVQIEINGEYEGTIKGKGRNVVRLRQKFDGVIDADLVILLRTAHFKGEIFGKRVLLTSKCNLDGRVFLKGKED